MISEYDKRQLLLMHDQIEAFKKGNLGLSDLVNNISALINVLESVKDDWIKECRSWWCDLEVVYAVSLEREEEFALCAEDKEIVYSALNNIEILVTDLLKETSV